MKNRHNLGRYLQEKFIQHKVRIVQAPFDDVLWKSYLGVDNYEKIEDLKSCDLTVFDFSSEHWGDGGILIRNMCEVLRCAGINFLILSHNPEHHAPDQGVLFYPHWYWFATQMFDIVPLGDEKKYLIGCLNGTPRPHRISNLLILMKKPYWPQCCTSFFASGGRPSDPGAVKLNTDEIEFWNQIEPRLPLLGSNRYSEINLPSITDSYVNLVTETTVRADIFLTEKIWKPVAAGQLFVTLGNPGSMAFLQSQGVDTFSDIIDHSHYDNETHWRVRLKRLHEVLDALVTQDLASIYKYTHQRRQQNQQNFFSGVFGNHYHQTLLDTINKRLECINTQN